MPTGTRAFDRLLKLLTTHAFEKRRVVLTSGRVSDFFIDCKQAILSAEGHALVGEVMLDAIGSLGECAAVAGVELGGCSLASSVALTSYVRGRPLDAIYVRKGTKAHGSQRVLEGNSHIPPGSFVAIVEDTTTTGGSTLKAISKIVDAGYRVRGVVTLVDRLEGAREAIEATGAPFIAIYTRHNFPA